MGTRFYTYLNSLSQVETSRLKTSKLRGPSSMVGTDPKEHLGKNKSIVLVVNMSFSNYTLDHIKSFRSTPNQTLDISNLSTLQSLGVPTFVYFSHLDFLSFLVLVYLLLSDTLCLPRP